ncbi:MAG: L,D-transpeptidase family protein, partial [Xanthomonadales bacterium]|nr:L,D-transpeptidase family protein [Xanthomonadales bacterium]
VLQLAALPPPHEGYLRLSEALQELQRKRDAGLDWPRIPDGPLLEAGDTHPQLATLRERLAREGFEKLSAPAQAPEFFDAALADALQAAQRRLGVAADGVLGPATRRALNRTLGERIEQVRLNMDRWRWLPDDPGTRYILVNLARFRLDLIENGESVLTQKVIVGKPYLSTPAFAGNMTYMVFNPYWEIPPNLGRRSVVPKQLENPDYFDDAGIEILSGWSRDAQRILLEEADLEAHQQKEKHYRLRQAPGPKNALGKVKFMFPNEFNVYLHDTPERDLFNRDVRSFSSGCVRVEDPLTLAQRILGVQGMSPAAVAARFDGGPDQTVVLKEPLPVYLGYWTAWVDDDGRLVYADDIYGRDEKFLEERYAQDELHRSSTGPQAVAQP